MKDFSKIASGYRREASRLNNADGSPGAGVFQDSFLGQKRSSNFLGQNSRMSSADGSGASASGGQYSTLSDTQKTYTAVLSNTKTSGSAVTCTLFGAFIYGTTNDQIGGVNGFNGATVTIAESSHAQVRAQSVTSPFWINGLRYRTTTTAQMDGYIGTIQSADSAGTLNTSQFRPLNYFTAAQNQNTQSDAPNYKFQVDGTISFLLPVITNETVTMVLQIGARWTPQNTLQNDSPLQVAAQNPLATGTTTVVVGG